MIRLASRQSSSARSKSRLPEGASTVGRVPVLKPQEVVALLRRHGFAEALATQTGMTNQWLASQGLLSVRDLWMKAHGYA